MNPILGIVIAIFLIVCLICFFIFLIYLEVSDIKLSLTRYFDKKDKLERDKKDFDNISSIVRNICFRCKKNK